MRVTWSDEMAELSTGQGIDAYIATGGLPHGEPPQPRRGSKPRDADVKTQIARKLRSKARSAIYAQRKAIVEGVRVRSGKPEACSPSC